ncbi:MAG TPA: invasion associated locus B family protein [Methylocystis sp.]|nr:invasion associated locus B family protein [Methylocystis sp.]
MIRTPWGKLAQPLAAALALSVAAAAFGAPASALAKPKPASSSKPDEAQDSADKKDGKKGDKAGAGKSRQLGSYSGWNALASTGKEKTCYALGSPKDRSPKAKLKDTQAFLFISTRPGEGVRDEVAIDLGYPTKDNSAATADVDGDAYDLVTKGSNAWVKNPAKEKEFVDALKGGAKLVVKASSARGSATTDVYSLKGLSDALARVAQECK